MSLNDDYITKAATQSERKRPNLANSTLMKPINRSSSESDDMLGMHSEKPEDIVKQFNDLKTAETDMLFSMLANESKLLPKEERKPYVKQDEADSPQFNTTTQAPPLKPTSYMPDYSPPPPQPASAYKTGGNENEMLERLDLLRQLGELVTTHGVKLSQNYNMNSDITMMRYELDLHRKIRDKNNGVNWFSKMLVHGIYGIELANEHYDPFGFQLKGWSEAVSEDISSYYDVLGELYEKWYKSGKPFPPELKLAWLLASSAASFHQTHHAVNNMPNLSKANPTLINKLQQQAAKATQQAEDINTLRAQEAKMRQQLELADLQRQLDLANSHAMPSETMPAPTLPNSLRGLNFDMAANQEQARQQAAMNVARNQILTSKINPNFANIIQAQMQEDEVSMSSKQDDASSNSAAVLKRRARRT